jgi:hypothetical protein
MDSDQRLRAHLLALLRGEGAHMTFDEAVADFPMARLNERPPNVEYTPWHLLEHLRRTQSDILDFVREAEYAERRWPDEYWPAPDAEADEAAWRETISSFRADLAAMEALVADENTDLTAPLLYGRGYSLLREALLVADHNAYHVGEFAILRQVMGTWPAGR